MGAIKWTCSIFIALVASLLGAHFSGKFDLLNAMDSNAEMDRSSLALYTSLFCLSPAVGILMNDSAVRRDTPAFPEDSYDFAESGDIEDEDYSQGSIYAIFYTLYKTTELTSNHGIKYFFTFNTWGFLPHTIDEKVSGGGVLGDLKKNNNGALAHYDFQTRFPEKDPERFGKSAYASLVTQKSALEYMRVKNVGVGDGTHFDRNEGSQGPKPVEIVEIGCGTGAGANLISRHIVKNSNYLALDMQKAAVNTCQERHEGRGKSYIAGLTEEEKKVGSTGLHPFIALQGTSQLDKLETTFPRDNPSLRCSIVPNGVGHKSNASSNELNGVPRESNTVDFVIISETHIADTRIGELELNIFKEIRRVLKPGGLFLWGNAIPTRVWREAEKALPELGFELVDSTDYTKDAVVARDLDEDRVNLAIDQMLAPFHVMSVPYFGPRCKHVVERLIANFYRHPKTALYIRMVTTFDSYLHQAWRLKKDAA